MRFALLIALSHLRPRQQDVGISVISAISATGVFVGVTAMIMVLAVMEGFEVEMRDMILGTDAHLVVRSRDGAIDDPAPVVAAVSGLDGVASAAPFREAEMMLRTSHAATGVQLRGLDLDQPSIAATVARTVDGIPEDLSTDAEQAAWLAELLADGMSADGEKLPGLVLGIELADQLWIAEGARVHIIDPSQANPLAPPKVRAYRVAGVSETGQYIHDAKRAVISLPEAQVMLGDGVDGVEARLSDVDAAAELKAAAQAALGEPLQVRHWMELNETLFAALRLQKLVMALILSLITVVAGMNIVGFLILAVVTRSREISILRAMGASERQIRQVFVLEGLLLGLAGTALGSVAGLLGAYGLKEYRFELDQEVYELDALPVVIDPGNTAAVAVAAIVISLLCTLYPATVAARTEPLDGLRK